MAQGHCVDWSRSGATACQSPRDCSGQLPSADFGNLKTGSASSLCVLQDGTTLWNSANTPDAAIGYCGAEQSTMDDTGATTCATNPCGVNGYCSHIRNAAGASVVNCFWPLS